MIRQAISCDICGAEKKQTNHWFVAHTHAGELRITGWSANDRLRAKSKHLCGQTCLHKLVDDFIASTLTARPQPAAPEPGEMDPQFVAGDASLTSPSAYARPALMSADLEAIAAIPRLMPVLPPAVTAIAQARDHEQLQPVAVAPLSEDARTFGSHQWRAEAWERERERERHAPLSLRRKSS